MMTVKDFEYPGIPSTAEIFIDNYGENRYGYTYYNFLEFMRGLVDIKKRSSITLLENSWVLKK